MPTEQIDPRYIELDSWSAVEMIAAMYEGQLAAAAAVRGALGAITATVEDASRHCSEADGSSTLEPAHRDASACRMGRN